MRDIFISYASEDRLAAGRLAEVMTRQGWSVWWDPDIPPGEIWDELIEQELAAVACVVVLWSASSVAKRWVKAEAAEAAARGILVPALIEDVAPPLSFRQIEAARLCDWRGEEDHREFRQLLGTISRLVGSRAPAAGAPPPRRAQAFASEFAPRREIKDGTRPESSDAPLLPRRPQAKQPASVASMRSKETPPLQPPAMSREWVIRARIAALFLLGGTCGFFVREASDLFAGRPRSPATQEIGDTANPSAGCPPLANADPGAHFRESQSAH